MTWPEVTGINPRTFDTGSTITVVQEFDDANDDGTGDGTADDGIPDTGFDPGLQRQPDPGQVHAHQRLRNTGVVLVDNVKPSLVTTSPAIPLVVRGGVNIVFSADITDGGAGYTSTVGTWKQSDIDDLNGFAGRP